jgi:hypothetical protein
MLAQKRCGSAQSADSLIGRVENRSDFILDQRRQAGELNNEHDQSQTDEQELQRHKDDHDVTQGLGLRRIGYKCDGKRDDTDQDQKQEQDSPDNQGSLLRRGPGVFRWLRAVGLDCDGVWHPESVYHRGRGGLQDAAAARDRADSVPFVKWFTIGPKGPISRL